MTGDVILKCEMCGAEEVFTHSGFQGEHIVVQNRNTTKLHQCDTGRMGIMRIIGIRESTGHSVLKSTVDKNIV